MAGGLCLEQVILTPTSWAILSPFAVRARPPASMTQQAQLPPTYTSWPFDQKWHHPGLWSLWFRGPLGPP